MTAPSTLPLFPPSPPKAGPRASEQAKQAARVGRGIDEVVMAIARSFAGAGPFDLGRFTVRVQALQSCSPDSPRRRLSALIRAGFIQGRCIDRSRSLWVIEAVKP